MIALTLLCASMFASAQAPTAQATKAQAPVARAVGTPAPPPPIQAGKPVAAPKPSGDPNLRNSNDPLTGLLDPFEYQARGRRDPFTKPVIDKPVAEGVYHGPFLPLQRFNLSDLKLTAIIWDVTKPKAMIIDPDNKVHIIGPNTKIGKNNGYVAAIREGEIVVVETIEDEGRLLSSTKILRLVSK